MFRIGFLAANSVNRAAAFVCDGCIHQPNKMRIVHALCSVYVCFLFLFYFFSNHIDCTFRKQSKYRFNLSRIEREGEEITRITKYSQFETSKLLCCFSYTIFCSFSVWFHVCVCVCVRRVVLSFCNRIIRVWMQQSHSIWHAHCAQIFYVHFNQIKIEKKAFCDAFHVKHEWNCMAIQRKSSACISTVCCDSPHACSNHGTFIAYQQNSRKITWKENERRRK